MPLASPASLPLAHIAPAPMPPYRFLRRREKPNLHAPALAYSLPHPTSHSLCFAQTTAVRVHSSSRQPPHASHLRPGCPACPAATGVLLCCTMDEDEVSLEEMEEYNMVASKLFRSEEDGYKFYNEYARCKGFSIRRDKVKRFSGTELVFWRRFYCSCEGYRTLKNFERTNRKREPRALTRCGCKAMLEIELNGETGMWFVSGFEARHSHRLANLDLVAFLRSHREVNDAQKAEAVELGVGGLRTCQIMEVMENNNGGYDKVGFVTRDLYNFFARYKKKRIEGRDADLVVNHLMAQQEQDPDFFFRYSIDEKGRLRNLFWADSQSQLDYEAFSDVVIFDSTYRVNRYNLPFVPFVGANHHRRCPRHNE
ncbi:hypothetical protein DAI22_10g205800 [Oryza sativa Japonica Group]|nr:hypothetical protein DAI22_10g205800 [Oryza sativa Japonica Group]